MTTHYALSAFQRDLLHAVAACEDPYGLALKNYLDDRYPEPVNHSRLYQNLATLVADGLLSKHDRDARSNSDELTAAGRRLLAHHAQTLVEGADRTAVTDGGTQ
jgi:DNA-binding PadR family transcriptional regulator